MILRAVRIVAQYNIDLLAETDSVLNGTADEALYKIYTNSENSSLKKDKAIKTGVPLIGMPGKSWFKATQSAT